MLGVVGSRLGFEVMDKDLESFWSSYLSVAFETTGSGGESLFRGVSDAEYSLIPSLARVAKESVVGGFEYIERSMMDEFKRLSVPLLGPDQIPKSNIEWLFLAQHYGLPTRLLDWTTNPLVALYFAVEKDDKKDAGVYLTKQVISDQYELFNYATADYTDEHKKNPISVFKLQAGQGECVYFRPRYSDKRFLNQKSVFMCPSDPFYLLPMDQYKLIKIESRWKSELRMRLRALGVSSSFVYPGLSGVSEEVKSFHFNPLVSGALTICSFKV